MRVVIVGKLCEIEPFPLSPFPFRDGGTKPEKAIRRQIPTENALKRQFLKILRRFERAPSPERGGGQGVGFYAGYLLANDNFTHTEQFVCV